MARIATQEAATRLARALASDIRLYHAEELKRGEDMSEAVGEARALFDSRVDAPLRSVFDAVMTDAGLMAGAQLAPARESAPSAEAARFTAGASSASTLAPLETQRPAEPLPKGLFQGEVNEPRSTRAMVLILLAVLLVAAGIGFWLAAGH